MSTQIDKTFLKELGEVWDEAQAIAELTAKLQAKIVLLRERNDDNEELEGALDTINDALGDPDQISIGTDELSEAVDFDELDEQAEAA